MKQKQWFLPELLLDQENRSKTTENKYVAIVANSHSFYNIPQKGLHILVKKRFYLCLEHIVENNI